MQPVYNRLKGDGRINIDILIAPLGILDNSQAHVKVYDKDEVIFEGDTYNGHINLCVKPKSVYKLVAYFRGQKICRVFYTNSYRFMFNFNTRINRTVIFSLRDYYYNLPIERGELFLWKNR